MRVRTRGLVLLSVWSSLPTVHRMNPRIRRKALKPVTMMKPPAINPKMTMKVSILFMAQTISASTNGDEAECRE